MFDLSEFPHLVPQSQTLKLSAYISSLVCPLVAHYWGYTASQWTQCEHNPLYILEVCLVFKGATRGLM